MCNCPAPHSVLGKRMRAAAERRAEWEAAEKRPVGRPGWVTTAEMARKAAEGLVRGSSPTAALREAGFPPATVRNSTRGINKAIRAELMKLGRRYIQMGKELTPEDREGMVRGRLA